MNKGNQNSTSGNKLDSDPPEASSTLTQQTRNRQTFALLQQTVAPVEHIFAPLLPLVSPVVQAVAPLVQNFVPNVRSMFGPLQPISFSVNTRASFPALESPRSFEIAPFPDTISKLESTSGARSFHLQKMNRGRTGAPLPILPGSHTGSSLRNQSTAITEECQQRLSKRQEKELPSPSKTRKTGTSSLLKESLSLPSEEGDGSKEQMTGMHQRQKKGALCSLSKEHVIRALKQCLTLRHARKKEGALSSPSKENVIEASKERLIAIHPRQKKGALSSPDQEAPTSKEQMTATHHRQKKGALFSPSKERFIRASNERLTAIHPRQKTGALSSLDQEMSTSKEQMITLHLKQKKGALSSPSKERVIRKLKQCLTARQHRQKKGALPSLSKKRFRRASKKRLTARQKKGVLFTPVETTSISRQQVTSDCLKKKTGRSQIHGEPKSLNPESSLESPSQHFQVPLNSESVSREQRQTGSGEQRQTYDLSSSSKKEKSRTFSWSTESQFASIEHKTATRTKQKTRTFSQPLETFASRKKVTAVILEYEEENQSTPVKLVAASVQQVTSDRPKQQTGLRPILGEPKSSLPESSLKNSFPKDYKTLQGTEAEKDDDQLFERLKQFDQYICVECKAKFPSQNELLMHEPIHFND